MSLDYKNGMLKDQIAALVSDYIIYTKLKFKKSTKLLSFVLLFKQYFITIRWKFYNYL